MPLFYTQVSQVSVDDSDSDTEGGSYESYGEDASSTEGGMLDSSDQLVEYSAELWEDCEGPPADCALDVAALSKPVEYDATALPD